MEQYRPRINKENFDALRSELNEVSARLQRLSEAVHDHENFLAPSDLLSSDIARDFAYDVIRPREAVPSRLSLMYGGGGPSFDSNSFSKLRAFFESAQGSWDESKPRFGLNEESFFALLALQARFAP